MNNTQSTSINVNFVALILILLAVVTGWQWPVTVFAVVVNVVWTVLVLLSLACIIVLPIKNIRIRETNDKDAVDKAIDVLGTVVIIMFAIEHDLWYTVSVAGITVILAQIRKFKVRRISSES